jgi:hypothetical protein
MISTCSKHSRVSAAEHINFLAAAAGVNACLFGLLHIELNRQL